MANAFVYGTLMAPEVLNLLIKRVPPMKPAYIRGYKRYRVNGQVFPAIVRDVPDSQVAGQVLLGLNEKEVHILDVYESEEYYKENVKPVLEDGTEVDAMVYIWHDKFRPLLESTAWEYSVWREHHLHHWVARSEAPPPAGPMPPPNLFSPGAPPTTPRAGMTSTRGHGPGRSSGSSTSSSTCRTLPISSSPSWPLWWPTSEWWPAYWRPRWFPPRSFPFGCAVPATVCS